MMKMSRKPRLRLDILRSDYDAETATATRGEGTCSKLAAITSSMLGITVLISAFLLLRDQRLQVNQYWDPMSPLFRKKLPTNLLGSAATNAASSVLQIIGSLMFLFQDISINVWKWLNFTILMVSSLSILILEKEEHPTFPLYRFHFIALVINCVSCVLFLLSSIFCRSAKSDY